MLAFVAINSFANPSVDAVRAELKRVGVRNPEIALAQAVLETGWFKSNVCKNKNNLFGLYNSNKREYYSFKTWQESVVAYHKWIESKWNGKGSYFAFLERIGYAKSKDYTQKVKAVMRSL